jgi:hypothetical protein
MGENATVRGGGAAARPGGATAPRPATGARPPLRVAPPAKATAAVAPARDAARGRRLLTTLVGFLVLVNLAGLPYYMLPTGERMRHVLHPWLKPTGYIGQSAGFLSLAFFLYLWLYPMRKKFRWLEFTGTLAGWLDIHVAAGLLIPLLAALHAAWHFTGLIGLGYGAMMIVCLSGIVGRYFYVRIPRSRSGLEMNIEDAEAQRRSLQRRIVAATGLGEETVEQLLSADPLPYRGLGPLRTILRMMLDDVKRWRGARRLRRRWRQAAGRGRVDRAVFADILRLARRQMALGQQIRMLDATHRVFRYWHVAHRPFAITALVAVLLHVGTAIALGVTWVR